MFGNGWGISTCSDPRCGTNFSLNPIVEEMEAELGVPVIGINAALLWYALRECGVDARLEGCGRLLREH